MSSVGLTKGTLQARLADILLEVLRRLAPQVQLPEDRVLQEFDSLLACTSGESSPSRQYPGTGSGLSATCLRPNAVTSSASIAMHFQHDCSRFTCSVRDSHCSFCERNPERRCEPGRNFAAKQVEGQALRAPCGAPVRVCFKSVSAEPVHSSGSSLNSAQSSAATPRIYFEVSILSGALHESWRHQAPEGVSRLDDSACAACEVLKTKRSPKKALLTGGWMSVATKEGRVRLRPCHQGSAGLELCISENSEARLGKDMQYKLLVRAISEDSGEELAQLVSPGFAACTTRSRANFKPDICCLEDSVKLLEGLGEKTRTNLLDVRQCALDNNAEECIPEQCINTAETVRQFNQLADSLKGQCPKALQRALLPEAAVEHGLRAVEPDDRMRRWKAGPDSQWELLFRCHRGQVRWSTPAALVDYGRGEVLLEGYMSQAQAGRMMQLAAQAFHCWKQAGHPGWALDARDSSFLDTMHRREVARRSEGSGNCYPTPSGPMATQMWDGGMTGLQQSLAELQGAEGSVRGISRAALLAESPSRGGPSRAAPLNAGTLLAMLQQQEQLYGMYQELGIVSAPGLGNSEAPSASRAVMQSHALRMPSLGDDPNCILGAVQGLPCCVLPGKPLTREDVGSPIATQAAGQAEDDTGHVAEFAAIRDGVAGHDDIPLTKQLQMPLPPVSEGSDGEGHQNSPRQQELHTSPGQGSQSSPGSGISPSPEHDVCSSPEQGSQQGLQNSPGQDLCNRPEKGFYSGPKQGSSSTHTQPGSPQSPSQGYDGLAQTTSAAEVTPGSSSITRISACDPDQDLQPHMGPMRNPSKESHGPRKQSSEAQALSQALSLTPEHEQDLLNLEEFDSGPASHAMMASEMLELLAGTHRQSVVPSSVLEQQDVDHEGPGHLAAPLSTAFYSAGEALHRRRASAPPCDAYIEPALKRQKTLPEISRHDTPYSWGLNSPGLSRLRSLPQPQNPLPRQLLFPNCQGRASGQSMMETALPPMSYALGSSGQGFSDILTHGRSSSLVQGIPANALISKSIMQGLSERAPQPHRAHVQGACEHALVSGPDERQAQGHSRHALPSGLTSQGSSTIPVGWESILPPAINAAAALQQDATFQLHF